MPLPQASFLLFLTFTALVESEPHGDGFNQALLGHLTPPSVILEEMEVRILPFLAGSYSVDSAYLQHGCWGREILFVVVEE